MRLWQNRTVNGRTRTGSRVYFACPQRARRKLLVRGTFPRHKISQEVAASSGAAKGKVEHMMPSTYEQALLVLATWRAAKSDNIDELTSIMCTFRNRVMKFDKTYSEILSEAEINRGYPPNNHPLLIMPGSGLLSIVEDVYTNKMPDYTSSANNIEGALYFGRVQDEQPESYEDAEGLLRFKEGSWFYENVIQKPEKFQLLGTWGSQSFYGEIKNNV